MILFTFLSNSLNLKIFFKVCIYRKCSTFFLSKFLNYRANRAWWRMKFRRSVDEKKKISIKSSICDWIVSTKHFLGCGIKNYNLGKLLWSSFALSVILRQNIIDLDFRYEGQKCLYGGLEILRQFFDGPRWLRRIIKSQIVLFLRCEFFSLNGFLDDGGDQSRLEVDNSLTGSRQTLKNFD